MIWTLSYVAIPNSSPSLLGIGSHWHDLTFKGEKIEGNSKVVLVVLEKGQRGVPTWWGQIHNHAWPSAPPHEESNYARLQQSVVLATTLQLSATLVTMPISMKGIIYRCSQEMAGRTRVWNLKRSPEEFYWNPVWLWTDSAVNLAVQCAVHCTCVENVWQLLTDRV